jgi:nitrate reductase gamma subunit
VNQYALGVVFVVFGTLTVSFMAGLKYSQAVLVFGLVSALAAPAVIHEVPNASIATGLFAGLTLFASFPFRKLFKIDGMVEELAVNFAYAAVLWIVGFGWKRIWPKAKF